MKRACKYFIFIIQLIISVPLFANSNWVWFLDDPTIMPMAIIFTLLFEVIFIIYFNKIKNLSKIIFGALIIVISNILSFLFSILFLYLSDGKWFFGNISKNVDNNFLGIVFYTLWHFPFHYNYGIIESLIYTLLIEVPFVYNILKFKINNKKKVINNDIYCKYYYNSNNSNI